MHNKHLSYSTINAIKSVITVFAVSQEKNTPMGYSELVKTELVKQFMKELFMLNLPLPRYYSRFACSDSPDFNEKGIAFAHHEGYGQY